MDTSPIAKPTVLQLGLLALLALVFASAFLAIKVVVPETGSWWLAALRVSIAFLFLLPIAAFSHFTGKQAMHWPQGSREWRLISLVMLFNVVAPFFLISWAEKSIDAGMTALLMGVAPFIALIASHIATTDDRLTASKLTGVIIAFVGILVLVGIDVIRNLGQNLPAQGAAMLAAACYVTSGLLVRRLSGFSSLHLSTLVMGMAAISSVIMASILVGIPTQSFSADAWYGLLYLGLVPTGMGILLRYYLVARVGVSAFAVGMNIIPVFGVAMGVLFLDEALTYGLVAALVLVLIGQFIIQRGKA